MDPIMMLAQDGAQIAGYKWPKDDPKAVIVIAHGMAEHSARYDRFAKALNENGYAALAIDLRGHGKSIKDGLVGYFDDKSGWRKVLGDINGLVDMAKAEYPGKPVVLFGHSMGSIFARAYMMDYGKNIDACIMSGVTVNQEGLRDIAPALTKIVSWFGAKKPSNFLNTMSFGAFNKAFEPARTEFDWLSRDEAEVDKYVEDELCGFVCTPSLFHDVSKTIVYTLKKDNIAKIPKDLDIIILSGAKDPVGRNGFDAKYLYESYAEAGLNTEYKVYEDARHEILNETNRDDVTKDIINYLEDIVG